MKPEAKGALAMLGVVFAVVILSGFVASRREHRPIPSHVYMVPNTMITDGCTALVGAAVNMPGGAIDTVYGLAVLPCPDGSGRTMENLFKTMRRP